MPLASIEMRRRRAVFEQRPGDARAGNPPGSRAHVFTAAGPARGETDLCSCLERAQRPQQRAHEPLHACHARAACAAPSCGLCQPGRARERSPREGVLDHAAPDASIPPRCGQRAFLPRASVAGPRFPRLASHEALVPPPRGRGKRSRRGSARSRTSSPAHNDRHATKPKSVSFKTQSERACALFRCFRDLHTLGYKIRNPYCLGGRHVRALVEDWTAAQPRTRRWTLSPAMIQTELSHLRTFTGWIGKPGLVLPGRVLRRRPRAGRRGDRSRRRTQLGGAGGRRGAADRGHRRPRSPGSGRSSASRAPSACA